MGVVRERKTVTYPEDEQANLEGIQASPSDTQSDDEELITVIISRRSRRRGPKTRSNVDDLSSFKSNIGKRKSRRYMNRNILETLPKCDDDESDNIFEYYKGPFARLMEITDCAIECINAFIENLDQREPYKRVSHKIRRAMKIRRNFPSNTFKDLELQVIDFFYKKPKGVFTLLHPNSFERLFLHAVCQYHELHSIDVADANYSKVEVRNTKRNWIPVNCILCDYLLPHDS